MNRKEKVLKELREKPGLSTRKVVIDSDKNGKCTVCGKGCIQHIISEFRIGKWVLWSREFQIKGDDL